MKTGKIISIILLALAATLFISAGQSGSNPSAHNLQMSKIVGLVLDANNARIVDATIKIENARFSRVVQSGDEGNFEVELPAGEYQITVEKDGFQRFEISNFRVKANASELVNVHMKVAVPKGTQKIR